MADKIIIGCKEWVAFPELGIPAIKAKVDTGAKTSSIHAFNIHYFEKNDKPWVNFEVHPLQRNNKTIVLCDAEVIDHRNVKSSNGKTEKRYVIRTPFKFCDDSWDIELTLTNRDAMGCRMLLGREAMKNRMLVDPGVNSHLKKMNKKMLKTLYPE